MIQKHIIVEDKARIMANILTLAKLVLLDNRKGDRVELGTEIENLERLLDVQKVYK